MRKLFLLVAASLLTVPAFAADASNTANLTLTIDAYSYVTIDMVDDALVLNKGTAVTDSVAGTVYSGTNDPDGATVAIGITGVSDVLACEGMPIVSPGDYTVAYAALNSLTIAYGDASQSKLKGADYDNDGVGDGFTVRAKLGTDWYKAAPVANAPLVVTASLSVN